MCTSNRSTHQYLLPHTVSGCIAFGSVCLLVCPHVLYMWGYPTLHCCYLTKKSMVLNKLVDFVSVSGYKWSVCVPCKTLWGEPEWEQTARTELAFTELCWSVSAPYYRCLDHVLAVACPLSFNVCTLVARPYCREEPHTMHALWRSLHLLSLWLPNTQCVINMW